MDMILKLSHVQSIDAVIASCDEMAMGAIHVLKEYNMLTNTFVSGQNANIQSLRMILKNEQTITIAKSAKTVGYAMAELASQLASKNKKNTSMVNDSIYNGSCQVPSIIFDPMVIDKSNLEKEILNDGFTKKENLFN
jgi:D-xylose transport system substrate-binding protein